MTTDSSDLATTAAARLLGGAAWEDYCNCVREAGRRIAQWDDLGDTERVEWYRFLTRLMRNGFERFVENSDPDNPRLRDAPWRCFINLQSPDQDHWMTEFSPEFEYEITGRQNSVHYFVLSAWSAPEPAHPGAEDWSDAGSEALNRFNPAMLKTGAFLASQDLQLESDGSFRIVLSRREHPGNWLRLDPDTTGIIVRVVYQRRADETPPTMRIRRLDSVTPAPLTATHLANALARSSQLLLGYVTLVDHWWRDFKLRPNELRFSMATYLSNGGVADRQFGFGAWQKNSDEALLIEFVPPPCEYWIFQLCNVWQENLDPYEFGRGYVNNSNARCESDATVRLVIADRDPGIGGNWIDSFEHCFGMMGLRLINTSGAPEVLCRRVALAELQAGTWPAIR